MIHYEYVPVGHPQHGYLNVYEGGELLATKEEWARLIEMGGEPYLHRMAEQANARMPGEMIPLGDPRLYTHCQWYGKPVDREAEQTAAWDAGQWHTPGCYKVLTHPAKRRRENY